MNSLQMSQNKQLHSSGADVSRVCAAAGALLRGFKHQNRNNIPIRLARRTLVFAWNRSRRMWRGPGARNRVRSTHQKGCKNRCDRSTHTPATRMIVSAHAQPQTQNQNLRRRRPRECNFCASTLASLDASLPLKLVELLLLLLFWAWRTRARHEGCTHARQVIGKNI